MSGIIPLNPEKYPNSYPATTEDGWFKKATWNGKPALCRRVSVKVGPAPGNIPFYWSNLRIGSWYPAIEIVEVGSQKERSMVKGVRINSTKTVFGKPFFIDNEEGRGERFVLNEVTPDEEFVLRGLPGANGQLFRLVYTTEVIIEKV